MYGCVRQWQNTYQFINESLVHSRMKYTVEEWKDIVKDYLLEQNAKIAAGKGATDDKVMLERMRKENLHFVNRILKDYLPTLAD